MTGSGFFIGVAALAMLSVPVGAQTMTLDEAREAGKEMAQAKRGDNSLVPTTAAQAAAVPGYDPADPAQSIYFDDPERLVSDAQSMKRSSEAYRLTVDPGHVRPSFSNAEILATTSRATAIERDPSLYLAGEAYGGSEGSCTPLPESGADAGFYEATCNQGSKVEEEARTCSIRMVPQVTTSERWFYYGVPANRVGHGFADVAVLDAKVDAGICRATGLTKPICEAMIDLGAGGDDPPGWLKYCRRHVSGTASEYSCGADLPAGDLASHWNFAANTVYLKKEVETSVNVVRSETGCSALASDGMCTVDGNGDVCVEGTETRNVAGVAITQPCWAWERGYACHVIKPANDCSSLEGNSACSFVRSICLDEGSDGGPCKVAEKVFRCPTPSAGGSSGRPQYVCGDDVYCINGDCEPIVREASTEFRDALVGLHALDQSGKEFDEANYRVFTGSRETCHKPVFGLINCCAGKVSGLVPLGAGAAALAGGPAAIAAFATPFLTLFACSQDEMKLDIRDRMGLCHNLGSYCSSSFLGICSTKRTAYCCFESKLSRILQEQGRPQIGKSWGSAKNEQCQGFTIEEFASLDLSKMDFTDVYADFLDAAKLPDEVQTLSEIQQKISGYYDLHGR